MYNEVLDLRTHCTVVSTWQICSTFSETQNLVHMEGQGLDLPGKID